MGEQHLDLLPSSSRVILPAVAQTADRLWEVLIYMVSNGSVRRIGAGLLELAGTTGFLIRLVYLYAGAFPDPVQRHFVAFKAGVAVALRVILEMA